MIRKSAYGRTQLFLPSSSAIVREVKCMGGIARYDTASVYHVMPDLMQPQAAPICCWHCCEQLQDGAACLPIPRVYDSSEQMYHVYGAVCSPGCAKSYILEHTTFDRGEHLNVLTRMLREVYGLTHCIRESPPRASLARFGGVFAARPLAEHVECRMQTPPFVSYTMIAEEHQTGAAEDVQDHPSAATAYVEEADTFEEPQGPGMFTAFVRTREAAAPAKPKRRSQEDAPASGPMAKFIKSS